MASVLGCGGLAHIFAGEDGLDARAPWRSRAYTPT
jgi:hypothetical protein